MPMGRKSTPLERNGAPFYMTAEAYIRTSGNGPEPEYVLDLSQQKLKIKGWPLMGGDSVSVILNGSGVKQLTFFRFSGRREPAQ